MTTGSANQDRYEHPSTDQKYGDQPDESAIQGLAVANVWVTDDGRDVRTPKPASSEKEQDGEAEADARYGGPDLTEQLFHEEGKNRCIDSDQIGKRQGEEGTLGKQPPTERRRHTGGQNDCQE